MTPCVACDGKGRVPSILAHLKLASAACRSCRGSGDAFDRPWPFEPLGDSDAAKLMLHDYHVSRVIVLKTMTVAAIMEYLADCWMAWRLVYGTRRAVEMLYGEAFYLHVSPGVAVRFVRGSVR